MLQLPVQLVDLQGFADDGKYVLLVVGGDVDLALAEGVLVVAQGLLKAAAHGSAE